MNQNTRTFHARWVLPISSEPISGGWVRLEGDQVAEVGHGRTPAGSEDLGDVVLLPGLVNAHTHLEFSDLQKPIGDPGLPLHRWIGQVVNARSTTSSEAKRNAIHKGTLELIATGTRLAGEITTPPCSYPRLSEELELITFAEVLGIDRNRSTDRYEAAMAHIEVSLDGGFSPHAPYSTTPQTIAECIDSARRLNKPVAMHVAESPDERELLVDGAGPFADALREIRVWREGVFPWPADPFTWLIDKLGQAPRALLVHGNYLNLQEIQLVAQHPNISVVYCPRTHQFFQHESHPVARMLAVGIRVALGTDSRASNPDLDLWNEVKFLLNHRPDIAPEQVLRMATMYGADAMGRPDLGRIEPGCRPGLGMVKSQATTIADLIGDLAVGSYQRTKHRPVNASRRR